MKTVYIYDGSFTGYLTAVYQVFEDRSEEPEIHTEGSWTSDFFSIVKRIQANDTVARRVWASLQSKAGKKGAYDFYCTFFSELRGVEALLLSYITYAYQTECFSATNYAVPQVQRVSQVSKMVQRERERLLEQIRFDGGTGGVYTGTCHPDFNVLPLILQDIKRRRGQGDWVVYDVKRGCGFYCSNSEINRVEVPPHLAVKFPFPMVREQRTVYQKSRNAVRSAALRTGFRNRLDTSTKTWLTKRVFPSNSQDYVN